MTIQPPRRKRKIDRITAWTEEELDTMSAITPQDVQRAKAVIQRASPLAAQLLDAKQEEENAPANPK